MVQRVLGVTYICLTVLFPPFLLQGKKINIFFNILFNASLNYFQS